MTAKDVDLYFQKNSLKGSFWNEIITIEGKTMIPTQAIKSQIGEDQFRQMECEVTTHCFDSLPL
jgi:hypothetical protein